MTIILAAAALQLLSNPCLARAKTDVITLYNGDRITGAIDSLYSGLLHYKTDAMGTLKVEWKEIAELSSDFNYEVRLTDGTRYFGNIGQGERRGELRVHDIGGQHTVDWLDVVELRPVEKTVRDRLDIYLSAGFSYTRASQVAQTTFTTELSYADEKARNTLDGRTNITNTNEKTTRSNNYAYSRQIATERLSSFRWIAAGYEDNDELDLNSRISLGVGTGRFFINTNQSRFTGSLGVQGLTEQFTGGGDQESLELVLGTDYDVWRFDTPELNLSLSWNIYPSVTEGGRLRSDADIKVRWEIIEDLFFDLTTWVSYDNESQEQTEAEIDWGISTGVGLEF